MILCDAYGNIDRFQLFSTLTEVLELADLYDCRKVFIDTREEKVHADLIVLDEFASSLPRDLKIAFLINVRQPTASKVKYISDVAQINHSPVKTFFNHKTALRWLHAELKQPYLPEVITFPYSSM